MNSARVNRIGSATLALGIAMLVASQVCGAARAEAASPGAAGTTRVGYLAGGSVYVDAGRSEGLREGDTLRVLRASKLIARLRVTYLSTHRAVCDTLSTTGSVRVGDSVAYSSIGAAAGATPDTPRAATAPPVAGAAAPAAPKARETGRPRPVHGRVGARWLAVRSGDTELSQPSGDVYLDAGGMAGGHLDALVDARGRLTSRRGVGGMRSNSSRQYVYRLAATLHDAAGHRRLVVGRQGTPALTGAGVLDGARAEWGGERWSAGAFSGTEPEPVDLGFGTEIVDHGVFVSLRARPGSVARWSTLAGATTSLAHGQPNRDYAFLQAAWNDERLSVFAAQEADLNRGWKRGIGESAISLTSALVTASLRATREVTLTGGYDHRRSVRLYRDHETPETEFDDHHRTGEWLGASAGLGGHARVSGDTRFSDAGARSVSGSAETFRLTAAGLSLRVRGTDYTSDVTRTWLWSVSAGANPFDRARLDVTAGSRATRDRVADLETTARWESAALDLALWRRWFATASYQRDHGESDDVHQAFTGLTWRF